MAHILEILRPSSLHLDKETVKYVFYGFKKLNRIEKII